MTYLVIPTLLLLALGGLALAELLAGRAARRRAGYDWAIARAEREATDVHLR